MTLFYVLVFTANTIIAQTKPAQDKKGTITGKVLDVVSKSSIEYASIAVYAPAEKKPLNGTTTDVRGNFSIAGLDSGGYRLVVDFIGYETDTISIFISSKKWTVKLDDILLSKKSQTLQSVVVVAKKPLLENKIDKMVYNAEQDVTAQGGVATDLLKKIPQVSVDVDGNVELQGNTNIRFLINGKPSSIFGNSLAEALQSIPASQIKSIEVITSPGAKYDAEGTGGIINIILKDSKVRGINGNINLAAGSRLENGSLNLHARKGNFGLNGFVNGNGQLTSKTIKSLDRSSYDTIMQTHTNLLQDGFSKFHRAGMAAGLGFEWQANKRNNISGNFTYDYFGNQGTGTNYQDLITESLQSPGVPVSDVKTVFIPNNHFKNKSYDYSLNYKKTFAKEDQELTAAFNTSYGNSRQNYTQDQYNAAGDTMTGGLHSINPGRDHETEMQIDYTQPLAEKVKLETGVKTALRDINSASDVAAFSPADGSYKYDSTQSNSLHYKRQVYAVYGSVSFPIGKWLEVKAGLRYERTATQADFSKASNTQVPGYNTLAPSILLAHHVDDNQTIKFSYARRVHRPDYFLLNPFINALDPKNISRGNPDLQPEKGDNAEFGYSKNFEKSGSINVNLFYRGSQGDIQPYIVYYPNFKIGDSTYTNVSVNTFENIGTEHMFGLNLFGSLTLAEKFTLRSNLSLFDKYIINRFVSDATINSFNYRINMNASYQASKTLVAEFFGSFNSPRNEVQGKYPSFTTYNFAFRKLIWNKKGSIGFTTTNPFSNYVNQETQVTGQQFVLNSLRRMPFRSFGVSFTWKFGKLEFKKESDDNDGHGGGGGESTN
ncbi:MAG: outer membrane beta-barrel family protein [Chitinophagaceae bacterium]